MGSVRAARESRQAIASSATWSAASIFVAAGAAVAVPVGLDQGPVFASWIGYALLLSAELVMLALMLLTLTREEAFDDGRALSSLPPILAWPLRVGWWVGGVAASLVVAVMAFTTPGGDGRGAGSRFAISVMAVVAIVAALFTSAHLPAWALPALAIVGGAVIMTAIVRGVVGLVAGAVGR